MSAASQPPQLLEAGAERRTSTTRVSTVHESGIWVNTIHVHVHESDQAGENGTEKSQRLMAFPQCSGRHTSNANWHTICNSPRAAAATYLINVVEQQPLKRLALSLCFLSGGVTAEFGAVE